MTEILVVGFPKSGNTWLTRLLADALDWPVRGIGEARPLAEQGEDREDGSLIRQLHLFPESHGNRYPVVASQHSLNVDAVNGQQRIVHIIRDPRDVAVSINHYWGINDLQRVITRVMAHGAHPLWGKGWLEYITAWRAALLSVIETRYEWLHADPYAELRRIVNLTAIEPAHPLHEVVERQAIEIKRADIAINGERMAHGITPQLTNLRAGRVGDWQTEFSTDDKRQFARLYGSQLLALGYETNDEW